MKKYHVVAELRKVGFVNIEEGKIVEGNFKDILRKYVVHIGSFRTKERAEEKLREMNKYYIQKNGHNSTTTIGMTDWTFSEGLRSHYGHNPADRQFVYGPFDTLEYAMDAVENWKKEEVAHEYKTLKRKN